MHGGIIENHVKLTNERHECIVVFHVGALGRVRRIVAMSVGNKNRLTAAN